MILRYRDAWVTFHRWMGLILGAVIAVLGVTGTLLVFEKELDAALNPALFRVAPQGEIQQFDDIVASAAAAKPGTRPKYWQRLSGSPHEAFKVVVEDSTGAETQVFVDPYSLKILGERSGLSAMALVRRIHGDLVMGTVGSNIVGILSIASVLFFAAGAVLWWPAKGGFRRALTVRSDGGTPRLMRDLHNVVGAIPIVLFVIAAMTVPPIVWKFTSPAGGPPSGIERPQASSMAASAPLRAIGWQRAAEIAAEKVPGQYVGFQLLAEGPRGVYMVRFWPEGEVANVRHMTNVFIEPTTGRFMRIQSPGTFTALSLIQADFAANIHSGSIAGLPGRIVMAVAGLALPVLFGTGLMMWLLKRRQSS